VIPEEWSEAPVGSEVTVELHDPSIAAAILASES
jgi:hypothetical protein